MAYAIKYLFKFESSNGTTREIRVLQDGYTGEAIQRPLGRAPVLKKQQNGPVHGTSLEFYAECNVDREFIEFYTSDPKAYRVDLYAGATLLWQGYITPELYSEPDIAPPYDVQVVATDGVGELKLYDYAAQGTVTLRTLLSGLLSRTGLGTDIYLISSLKAGSRGAGALLDMTINLDYMAGESCYDVLTYLLDTLHATITWWKGAWILTRETNVTFTSGKVRYFNTAGNSALLADSVQTLGSLRANPAWPVGQLSTVIDPAKNRVTVQAPWHVVTGLQNSDMTSDASWAKSNDASYGPDGYLFPNNDEGASTYATAYISQVLTMEGLRVPMSFELRATGVSAQVGVRVGAAIGVLLTYTVGNVVYHLRKGSEGTPEWAPGPAIGTTIDGSLVDYQRPLASFDMDRIQAETLQITDIPAFVQGTSYPSGTLTVYILGTCARVYAATLDVVLPKGYQDILRIDNGARGEGGEVEIAIGRETADNAYYAAFLQGLLLDSGNLITSFSDANFPGGMDYLAFIARDYALSVALPRAKVTGTVYLESGIAAPPLVFTKGALNYWLQTWSWNLYEDELEIEGLTLPSASLTVESETILESNGSTVSSAGGAGSSSAGSPMGGGVGTNYWEIDGTLNTLLKPKDAYAYVHSKDGLFFTGAALSGTVVPDLYVDTVNNQRVLRSPLPLITGGDQIVIDGTPGGGGGGGGATTLAGLDDTNITNPQAGQMLSWNGTKWVNTNAPTGSITSVSLAAGASNGTLHLVVNGTAQSDVAVTGLKALAYKDSLAFSEITGTASASQIPNLSWNKITSDKPTTLSGYGITDTLLVFNAKAASQTWGNQTGTFITGANDSTGGSIAFRRDNPVEGQMSMVIDGTVYVKEGNNRVLDTGDVGSTVASQTSLANYLPLTGGTLEKNDGNILNINSTSTAGHNYMYFKVGGTSKASVGYYSGLAYVANETTYARIGVNDSGTPQYWSGQSSSTAQTLLHTGNYTSFLNSVYHPYGGGNIAFQTSTLDASGQVTITGNWSSGTAGLVVTNNTSNSIPWLINSLAPNMPVGGFGGGIIFGKADSAYNTGVLDFYYAGAGSTSNYVGIGLYNHDNLLKVYGTGVTEVQSLKIGSATITWNSNGYLHIDKPLVTAGDQIVISGAPGGGGGGGATTLAGLDDVAITSVANGQLLQYNGSKWVNVAASSVGGVTSVAGRTGAITLSFSDITGTAAAAQIPYATTARYVVADNNAASPQYALLQSGAGRQDASPEGDTWIFYDSLGGTSSPWGIRHNQAVNTIGFIGAGTERIALNMQTGAITGASFVKSGGTSAQFLKADGSVDTNTYLTDNQTITLSGDVSGSGATSITTTIGEGKVTNAMLAGSIENSKLNTIGVSKGGTGLTTWTGAYRLVYSTAATTLTTLAPNSTTTRKFLRQVGANSAATAPAWDTVTKTDVGLSNVENTALSTWAGTTNITTLGTITSGTWNGSAIAWSKLSISAQNLYDTIGSTKYAPYNSDGYLPLTGGTLKKSTRDILVLNQETTSTGTVGPYITFSVNGTPAAGVGSNYSVGAYLENDSASGHPYINLDNSGVLKRNNTDVFYHSGNSNKSDVAWACSTLTASGQITATGTWASGTAGLVVTNNTTATIPWLINTLAPNMPVGGFGGCIIFGKANSSYNSGVLDFYYAGNGSTDNYVGIGLYGADNLVRVLGNGCLSIHPKSGASYNEGIRIHAATDGYGAFMMCGTDNTGDSGTSAKSWGLFNNPNGDFYINKNASAASTDYILCNVSGKWGIGTSAPEAKLHIHNTAYPNVLLSTTSSEASIYYRNSSGVYWAAGPGCWGRTAGYTSFVFGVYSGNGSSAWKAYITNGGNFVTAGDQVISSDLTLKENLTPVTYSVSDIAKARAVEFDWKDGRGHSMGSIAQDWLSIAPALVHGEEGNMSLAYGQLALVNTIIEAREIETLKARVAELEAEVKRLRMN